MKILLRNCRQSRANDKERPAISSGKLAKELNIDRVNLQKIAKGYRDIPKHRRGAFWRIMKKYGFNN